MAILCCAGHFLLNHSPIKTSWGGLCLSSMGFQVFRDTRTALHSYGFHVHWASQLGTEVTWTHTLDTVLSRLGSLLPRHCSLSRHSLLPSRGGLHPHNHAQPSWCFLTPPPSALRDPLPSPLAQTLLITIWRINTAFNQGVTTVYRLFY